MATDHANRMEVPNCCFEQLEECNEGTMKEEQGWGVWAGRIQDFPVWQVSGEDRQLAM